MSWSPVSCHGLRSHVMVSGLMSWSLQSLFMCLVFIAVNAENLASHRYVVENGNNIDKAISESLGHTVAALSQKIERLLYENFPFRFFLHERSSSCASFAVLKKNNVGDVHLKRVSDPSSLFQLCHVFHVKRMNKLCI